MGTDLYHRIITFEYRDADRKELMEKVWRGTPWVVNVKTDSIGSDQYRSIMQWCRDHIGAEAWPIHGRPGEWQSGSATVFGETFMGFATEARLSEFRAAFGDLIIHRKEQPA